MASTSVYLPEHVKVGLDRVAARTGKTRNRLVVEACEALVRATGGEWPPGFFENDDLTPRDLAELRKAGDELARVLRDSRRNRRSPPF